MKCVDTPGRAAAFVDESAVPSAFRVSQPVSTVRTVRAAPAATRTVRVRSRSRRAFVAEDRARDRRIGPRRCRSRGHRRRQEGRWLIGAAIGGGAAFNFEAIKRKD